MNYFTKMGNVVSGHTDAGLIQRPKYLYGGQPGSRVLPMENDTRPIFTENKVNECQATNQRVLLLAK